SYARREHGPNKPFIALTLDASAKRLILSPDFEVHVLVSTELRMTVDNNEFVRQPLGKQITTLIAKGFAIAYSALFYDLITETMIEFVVMDNRQGENLTGQSRRLALQPHGIGDSVEKPSIPEARDLEQGGDDLIIDEPHLPFGDDEG